MDTEIRRLCQRSTAAGVPSRAAEGFKVSVRKMGSGVTDKIVFRVRWTANTSTVVVGSASGEATLETVMPRLPPQIRFTLVLEAGLVSCDQILNCPRQGLSQYRLSQRLPR